MIVSCLSTPGGRDSSLSSYHLAKISELKKQLNDRHLKEVLATPKNRLIFDPVAYPMLSNRHFTWFGRETGMRYQFVQ